MSSQTGVDLNRNASTANWGGLGTSANPCDQTFKGASAASEPEQQGLQTLLSQLFADAKGPGRNDPAATTAGGVVISLHTYSNFVLFPYGDAKTGGYAPNDAALRTLGFRFNYFNGYRAGTGDEILYPTTGTTDDWAYGTLGVASYTFEVGPTSGSCSGFTPQYACQDSTFWPKNLGAFLYAAKTARNPYLAPAGPTTTSASLNAASVTRGTSVTLSATANDRAFGSLGPGSGGRPIPTAQTVNAGRYTIDVAPWTATSFVAMTASDGSFNNTSEGLRATVATAALSVGRHTIYVQGRDNQGNWGPPTAVFLTVN